MSFFHFVKEIAGQDIPRNDPDMLVHAIGGFCGKKNRDFGGTELMNGNGGRKTVERRMTVRTIRSITSLSKGTPLCGG